MSWGERSCKDCGAPEGYLQMDTCNVDCPWYEWDGKTQPDSVSCKEFGYSKKGKKERSIPQADFTGLQFCERCKAMRTRSHIKKCKKREK